MLTGGLVIKHLIDVLRWDSVRSYRVIFIIYAALGLFKTGLVLMLSPEIESEEKQKQQRSKAAASETAPLLNDASSSTGNGAATAPKETGLRRLLPKVSRESVSVVAELCVLFALDSFASGLATM